MEDIVAVDRTLPDMPELLAVSRDERALLQAALMLVVIDDHIVQLIDPAHMLTAVKKRLWWRERFEQLFDEIGAADQAALLDRLSL